MGQLAGVGMGFAVAREGLLRMTEDDEQMGKPRQAHHARVDGVDESRGLVARGIVEREPGLEMGTALDQPSELAQSRPDHAVACHPRRGVAPLLGQLQQLPRRLEGRSQLTALKVHDRSTVQGREDLRDITQLAAKLARTGVGATGLRRRKASRGKRRLAQRELKDKLAPLTLGPCGQAGQHLEPFGQVRDRLGHGGARERLLPGPLPVVDGALHEPRLHVVLGEQLGLGRHGLREPLLQQPGDPAMQLLSLHLEQALVGGVPHQRVLERVAGLRRRAAAEHQLGRGEPVQGDVQLGNGQR